MGIVFSEDLGPFAALAYRGVLVNSSIKEMLKKLPENEEPEKKESEEINGDDKINKKSPMNKKKSSIVRRKSFKGKSGKSKEEIESDIGKLVGNSEHRNDFDLFSKTCVACILTHIFTKQLGGCQVTVGELLLQYLQSFECNAIEISEFINENYINLGSGIYPTFSLNNHSCNPNVGRWFYNNTTCTLRTLTPIKIGEEILDSYFYHYTMQPKSERQLKLQEHYFFECKCKACISSWPTKNHLTKELQLVCSECQQLWKPDTSVCRNCFNTMHEEDAKALISKSRNNFEAGLLAYKHNDAKAAAELFNFYLTTLYKFTVTPNYQFAECQELLRYCYDMLTKCSN